MPLVTRQVNQGNLFKQSLEPTDWQDGDLWSDTTGNILKVNVSGIAITVGQLNQDSIIDWNGTDIPIGITI